MTSLSDTVHSVVSLVDRYQRRHVWLAFPIAVARKFGEDGAGGLAGLIAYYGFFSVFPLLLVFVTILGFVLHGDPSLEASIVASAKHQFPSLSSYLKIGSIAGSGLALGVGIGVALWAGLGVTRAAQRAMNAVWDVPVTMRPNFWRSRLRGLGLLALLGTTTVVSTGTSALRGVGGPLAGVFTIVGIVAPLVLNIGLYLVAFQVLTAVHLTWRQVLPGSVIGAIAWTGLQALGGYYTRHQVAHASQLYGTFAVVIGLLAWIHLGAQVTLYAAELNVVWARRLWPRSMVQDDLTDADRRSFASQRAEHDRLSEEGAAWRREPDEPDERDELDERAVPTRPGEAGGAGGSPGPDHAPGADRQGESPEPDLPREPGSRAAPPPDGERRR